MFKFTREFFCVDFSWKSAILHTFYARVNAAMPVACTVIPSQLLSSYWNSSSLAKLSNYI